MANKIREARINKRKLVPGESLPSTSISSGNERHKIQETFDEKQKSVEVEEDDIISKSIGQFGRWQLKLTFLLSLVNVPCTWHVFAHTFHTYEKDVWCERPERFRNLSPELWKNCTQPTPGDICRMYDVMSMNNSEEFCERDTDTTLNLVECRAWEFAGSDRTIISEFNLVCDKESWVNIAEMMFLGGVAVGGLVCGVLSDKYGRKKTLFASLLIQNILGTLIAVSPWFLMYVILRTVLGFFLISVALTGFVLVIELVGGSWRTVSGMSYLFPLSLSYVTLAGIAYLIRDWKHLQLAISLPSFLFLGLWWIVPESPRWLLALGRTKEIMIILKKAAKINRRELPDDLDKQLSQSSIPEAQSEKVTVLDLFRTAQMRKKTLLLFIIWFTVYLLYYGLVLNMDELGGNLYVNSAIQGLVEIPAIAFSILIVLKGNKRWPLALTMIVSGLNVFITAPFGCWLPSDLQWISIAFTMIGKLSITSSDAIMLVYTAELYPTTIRNIGVGAVNVPAGIALMLVPYLWYLGDFQSKLPVSILGVIGVFGGLSVLGLPETGNGPLMHTLKEEHQTEQA